MRVDSAECAVEYLDDVETEAMFERVAQAKMGIGLAEFRLRTARGDYQRVDWDTVPGLVDVAVLVGIR